MERIDGYKANAVINKFYRKMDKLLSERLRGFRIMYMPNVEHVNVKGKIPQPTFEEVENYKNSIVNIACLLSYFYDENLTEAGKFVICDLSRLTDALKGTELSSVDILYVVAYIINNNINRGILEYPIKVSKWMQRVNIDAVQRYAVKKTNSNRAMFIIQNVLIEYIGMFFKDTKNKTRELFETSFTIDSNVIKECNKIIFEHLINKPDSFDSNDINLVVDALTKLRLNYDIVMEIEQVLYSDLQKREEALIQKEEGNTKKKKQQVAPVIYEIAQPKRITNKEIEDTLREYFNFDTMEATKYLTMEEIAYCIYLMRRININSAIISDFIREVTNYNRNCRDINPFSRYNELYDKFSFYKRQKCMELYDLMTDANEAILNAMISDDKSYQVYKAYLASILAEAEEKIKYLEGFEEKLVDAYTPYFDNESKLRHR